MICVNCGKMLPDSARKCAFCGEKVSDDIIRMNMPKKIVFTYAEDKSFFAAEKSLLINKFRVSVNYFWVWIMLTFVQPLLILGIVQLFIFLFVKDVNYRSSGVILAYIVFIFIIFFPSVLFFFVIQKRMNGGMKTFSRIFGIEKVKNINNPIISVIIIFILTMIIYVVLRTYSDFFINVNIIILTALPFLLFLYLFFSIESYRFSVSARKSIKNLCLASYVNYKTLGKSSMFFLMHIWYFLLLIVLIILFHPFIVLRRTIKKYEELMEIMYLSL